MIKTRLFVVDSYLLNRVTYKKYFENDENFTIIKEFSSAISCIEYLEKETPDIILIDVELSDIDGISATKIIKEKYPQIKVLISTTCFNPDEFLASLSNGACGYYIKNNIKNLKKNLIMALDGKFCTDIKLINIAFSTIYMSEFNILENISAKKKVKNSLTEREMQVLKLLVDGKTNAQIGKEIDVSQNTIKAHIGKILEKFSVKDRVQAAVKAVKLGLF